MEENEKKSTAATKIYIPGERGNIPLLHISWSAVYVAAGVETISDNRGNKIIGGTLRCGNGSTLDYGILSAWADKSKLENLMELAGPNLKITRGEPTIIEIGTLPSPLQQRCQEFSASKQPSR